MAVQKLLQARMLEAKAKNPSFSLRAFAGKIGISPAMVSRVLSGERQVSRKLIQKIMNALMLDPEERAAVLARFPASKKRRDLRQVDAVDPSYLQLTADHFRMISEWHYFAILSLFKTKNFKSEPAWIAARLGLNLSTVTQSLERLKRLELICETKDGGLQRNSSRFQTTDDVVDLSIRKAHFETLELARKSLESDPVERRDFTSLTLAFPSERMGEAKALIRKFQDEFDSTFEANSGPKDEVYRLWTSLFPLTKENQKKENI